MRQSAAQTRAAFPTAEELQNVDDAVAQVARLSQLTPPPPQVPIPMGGAPQRDGINALIDQHVIDVAARIDGLIKQLEAMKQHVLVGSAAAKETLHNHVDVCQHVDREAERISTIVDELAQKVMRL